MTTKRQKKVVKEALDLILGAATILQNDTDDLDLQELGDTLACAADDLESAASDLRDEANSCIEAAETLDKESE